MFFNKLTASGGRKCIFIVLVYWLPVLIYAGLIFFLSSLSFLPMDETFPYLDKVAHMIEYGIFGFLLLRAFKNSKDGVTFKNALIFSILISVIYSFLDEFHQYFVPYRTADIYDIFFDGIGILIGQWFYFIVYNLRIE